MLTWMSAIMKGPGFLNTLRLREKIIRGDSLRSGSIYSAETRQFHEDLDSLFKDLFTQGLDGLLLTALRRAMEFSQRFRKTAVYAADLGYLVELVMTVLSS